MASRSVGDKDMLRTDVFTDGTLPPVKFTTSSGEEKSVFSERAVKLIELMSTVSEKCRTSNSLSRSKEVKKSS